MYCRVETVETVDVSKRRDFAPKGLLPQMLRVERKGLINSSWSSGYIESAGKSSSCWMKKTVAGKTRNRHYVPLTAEL